MVIVNTDFLATRGLIVPCPHASCPEWDSDRNGGHCMCLNPPCREKLKEHTREEDERPLG